MFIDHFNSILFRRIINIKRSLNNVLISAFTTLFFSAISIIVYFLMAIMMKDNVKPITFNSFESDSNQFFIVNNESITTISSEIQSILQSSFFNDTFKNSSIIKFQNRNEANQYIYNHIENKIEPQIFNFGIGFNPNDIYEGNETGYNIIIYYNNSQSTSNLNSHSMVLKLFWKYTFGILNNFNISSTFMYEKFHGKVYSHIAPVMISLGLLSFVPIFMNKIIVEINGEIRPFMISCNLNLAAYWTSTLLIDYIFWIITITMIWAVFILFNISAVLDNIFNVWYVLAVQGLSFILSSYCFSFAFKTITGASRQSFIILSLLVFFPMMVDLVREGAMNPFYVDVIYGIFPQINIERLLISIMERTAIMKQPLSFYFDEKYTKIQLYMQF